MNAETGSPEQIRWMQLMKMNQELCTLVRSKTLVWTRRDILRDPPEHLEAVAEEGQQYIAEGVEVTEYQTKAEGWKIIILHATDPLDDGMPAEGMAIKDGTVIRMIPSDAKLAAKQAVQQFLANQ